MKFSAILFQRGVKSSGWLVDQDNAGYANGYVVISFPAMLFKLKEAALSNKF